MSPLTTTGMRTAACARRFTDEDSARTQAEVAKLVQLHSQDPELLILPAHDRRAFVELFGADDGEVPPCIGAPTASRLP